MVGSVFRLSLSVAISEASETALGARFRSCSLNDMQLDSGNFTELEPGVFGVCFTSSAFSFGVSRA